MDEPLVPAEARTQKAGPWIPACAGISGLKLKSLEQNVPKKSRRRRKESHHGQQGSLAPPGAQVCGRHASRRLLNPDYNRDVQTVLTPAYSPTDAYAGVLLSALGMIDTGTTAIVDLSQVSHSPEHSDACIRALQESGIRAVFSYHRGAGPAAQYPQDIKRLQRTYFSSKDQLLTLALTANLNANVFALARQVGVPVVQHRVGIYLSTPLIEL